MEEWGTIITTTTTILPFPTKPGRLPGYGHRPGPGLSKMLRLLCGVGGV